MKVPVPQPTGELYVDTCFQIDFEEFIELRNWRDYADLRDIPDTAMVDKRKALSMALSVWEKYDDFSFVYYWIAKLRHETYFPGEPIATCLKGLEKCRSKPILCGAIAMREFERYDLGQAVKWWVRSAAAQFGCRMSTDSFSLLNLAYIAEGLDLPDCQKALMAEAQNLQGIQFDAIGAEQRYHLARTQGSGPIKRTIRLLCQHYLSSS
ncbi:MAG: hypothetical protein PWQ55_1103 [Chloroflexota bacterium]|nr:hypothetical protein [Chloroflexota bacterium]